MMLKLSWIFGLISTRAYALRVWQDRPLIESRINSLDRSLSEDRLAIVLFILGAIILAYTFMNAPLLHST